MTGRVDGTAGFLDGGGEMGRLIRALDWAATALGAPEAWPQSLRSALSICLQSSFPTAIYWGPELRLLYNDAWAPIPADRHPWALGRTAAEVWPEIWEVVGPQFARVLETGEGFSAYDQMLPMMRGGERRETYWNYSFTPIRGEDGSVVGIFNQGHETTERVLGERRGRFLLALSDALRTLSDPRAVIETAQAALGRHLGANRVGYGEVEETARYFTTERNWTDGTIPSREGTHDLAGFGPDVLASLRAGIPLLIRDAAADPRTCAPASLAAFDAIDTRAVITASLVKDGRMRAALYVHARQARPWTEHDAGLVGEVAERTWEAVERARAEERLRASESRFRALVTAGAYSVFRMGPDWKEMRQLDGRGLLGDTPAGGEHWLDTYVVADDRPAVMAAADDAIRRKGLFELEHRVRRADGSTGWVLSRAVPVLGADGEILEWFGAASDVTARREAETALRESEARFRLIADAAPQIVWIAEADGRVAFFNSQWAAYVGTAEVPATAAEVAATYVHPDDAGATMAAFAEAGRTGGVFQVEHRIRRKDGAYRWFLVRAEPYRDPATGEILRWFGASVDIHDRRAAEAALRESEARLRELNETLEQRTAAALAERKVLADIVEGTDALVQVVDRDYRLLAINKASAAELERTFGLHPRVGDNILALFADRPEQQAAARALWSRALEGEEFTEVAAFGDDERDRRFYEMKFSALRGPDGERIGAYHFVYDVTEQVRDQARLAEAESQLRQAQKMEAVGQLTGGVAHDFNNLLTIIKSSTDLLRRRDLTEDRRKRYVDAISDTVDRASKLTGQLLAFARRQALKPEVFEAADRLRRITDMLRTIVGARVRIVSEIVCDPCWIEADLSQFETALVNMTVNARDAMNGEGELTITVDEVTSMPRIRGHGGAEGAFVAVSIGDTGHGIPADRLGHIFEPFYTTKDVGKGTGLGLSQVYGFAKQSGGDVAVESVVGRGTRFTLYLPRIDRQAAAEGAAPGQRNPPAEHGRGRRVLLVEDNMEVGRFSRQILQDLGYETTWAANADEALALIANGHAFDVVFSDVVMPGMSGIELGREIRRRHPGLPVVLTSGYSHVLAEEGWQGFELIQKPYAAEELSRVLRRVTGAVRRAPESGPAESSSKS